MHIQLLSDKDYFCVQNVLGSYQNQSENYTCPDCHSACE